MTRHVSAVRNFKDWLQPIGVELSNAFRPRAAPAADRPAGQQEVPHCFTLLQGRDLSKSHKDLMNETVQAEGTYCCVKMYVRDLNLSQPPLLVCTPERIVRVQGQVPKTVHAMVPLSSKQIAMYSALEALCRTKFALPKAAEAVRALLWDRSYRVFDLSWLEQQSQVFEPAPEGHAYFPNLPRSCWQLLARFR